MPPRPWRHAAVAAILNGLAALAALAAGQPSPGTPAGPAAVARAALHLATTAAAAAVAVRLGVPWGALVAGSAAGAGVALTAGWALFPASGPGSLGNYPGVIRDAILQAIVGWVTATAGVFLPPLLDPATRRRGPAVPPGPVAAVAAGAVLVLRVLEPARSPGGTPPGLLTLAAASGAAWGLVAAGLLLTAAGRVRAGAWCGGLGVVAWVLAAAAWLAAGAPWFP